MPPTLPPTLKAGTVEDFGDSLAEAMEIAMRNEWGEVMHGIPFPELGERDRRLLFTAIAKGIFVYLKAHEDALITSITHDDELGASKSHAVTGLILNL